MQLEVLRFSSQVDSTSGLLFELTEIGRKFLCYTLEDERRALKVRGETRVPAGTYKIELRNEGGFHQRYTKKYPGIHRGMLHITDVPNFEYILIHTEIPTNTQQVASSLETRKRTISYYPMDLLVRALMRIREFIRVLRKLLRMVKKLL